ncbi:PQQ-binding-like beta-propeller repeat protein [Maioricimonas sp. JC845]|uniref:outer membrane protein assembly factor BamB family protein n=1 Tax=Maioricimonas sp. JC845 TaxID=3232138 RepID=UPI003459FA67
MRRRSTLAAGPFAAALFTMVPVLTTLVGSNPAAADNWPQWRGPNANSISSETGIATEWSKTKNVAWRLPLPGPAGATPAIWNDRIFLTSSVGSDEGADLVLICANTKGEQLWQVKVGSGNKNARSSEGNSASASPSTDGKHVWVFFGTGVLACYDFDGNEVWKFNVQDRYGKFAIQFGMTSTPVLDGDHLYLQLIHGEMRGDYTVAKVIKLDKKTGKEIWAVDRPSEAIVENKHSYASPFIYDDGQQRFLVTHGADCTVAYDLEDGRELWRLSGLNGRSKFNQNQYDPTLRFVASPSFADNVIIVPTAKKGPVVAIRPSEGMTGEISGAQSAIQWVHEKTPDVCCPLILGDLVYFCRKDGKVFCLNLETGEELYYERTHNSQHRATPVYADGHIYLCARDGHCTVLKTGPEFEIVAENDLGETITASPAISDGTLYLRTYDALYAIREN